MKQPAVPTPNLDLRLENSEKIRTVSRFLQFLDQKGYVIAGTPMHTHLEDTTECWGAPGCPMEEDPDHVGPDRKDTQLLVRRYPNARQLTDEFLGIDRQEAEREMEELLLRVREEEQLG